MKTSFTVVLVCAGMLSITCAGVAWAQVNYGYICYNATQVCGTYAGQCYAYSAPCNTSQNPIQSVSASSLILGGCISDTGQSCTTVSNQPCTYSYFTGSNCSGYECNSNTIYNQGCSP
jgi:hypothetical protein